MTMCKSQGQSSDEDALRALFDEVSAPPSMEARWRSLATLAAGPAPPDPPEAGPAIAHAATDDP